MSVTTPTPGPSTSDQITGGTTEDLAPVVAPVVALAGRRGPTTDVRAGAAGGTAETLAEAGAASAEYAAVTACGVGLAGVLMKLLSSDFGQNLLETVLKFFLGMVGIG